MSTPSQIAVAAARNTFGVTVPLYRREQIIQSAIDKAVAPYQLTKQDYDERCHDLKQLRQRLNCDDSMLPTLIDAIDKLEQRATKAELQIMQLREALREGLKWFAIQNYDGDPELAEKALAKMFEEALSASAVIAGKWVLMEDVRPLLAAIASDHRKDTFLARHADKIKPA